jgi:hypothetical protein
MSSDSDEDFLENSFVDVSFIQEILPINEYEYLLSIDENATDSEEKFKQYIEKYKGTIVGNVLTKSMEEILYNIRNETPTQAYYMVCLSDRYRSGQLQDDENQSFEYKWLLASAYKGYVTAISQMADLFAFGNYHFKKNQNIADALNKLLQKNETDT